MKKFLFTGHNLEVHTSRISSNQAFVNLVEEQEVEGFSMEMYMEFAIFSNRSDFALQIGVTKPEMGSNDLLSERGKIDQSLPTLLSKICSKLAQGLHKIVDYKRTAFTVDEQLDVTIKFDNAVEVIKKLIVTAFVANEIDFWLDWEQIEQKQKARTQNPDFNELGFFEHVMTFEQFNIQNSKY